MTGFSDSEKELAQWLQQEALKNSISEKGFINLHNIIGWLLTAKELQKTIFAFGDTAYEYGKNDAKLKEYNKLKSHFLNDNCRDTICTKEASVVTEDESRTTTDKALAGLDGVSAFKTNSGGKRVVDQDSASVTNLKEVK